MTPIITLHAIEQAMANLAYQNKYSLKYKLIHAIKDFIEDENALRTIESIPSDILIKVLWNTGNDQTSIKKRNKNLSSIRSSINRDLKKLYDKGKNTEGVTINTANIFVMSEEAKDKALKSFLEKVPGDAGTSLEEIAKIINIVDKLLSSPEVIQPGPGANRLEKLTELTNSIRSLLKRVDLDEIDEETKADIPSVEIEDDDLLEDSQPDDDLEELEVLDEIDEETQADIPSVEIEDDDLILDIDTDTQEEADDIFEEVLTNDNIPDSAENDDASTPGGLDEIDALSKINPEDLLSDDEADGLSEDTPEKARLLAEEFNQSLAAMDRFYNQYILIPPGRYIVGNKQVGRNERPEKTIQLPSFYIGKYPITNALFEIFVDNTGYKTTAEKSGAGTVYYGRFENNTDPQTGSEKRIWNATLASRSVKGACWYQPSGPGNTIHKKRNHPVVQVSLEDAMAFAAWTGKRLPTEDEWEAAARTAAGYEFPWGDGWQEGTCNIEASCICDTTPVDTYFDSGNDLGTIDTLGNVLEWTSSEAPLSSKNHLFKYCFAKGGSWVSGNDISLSSRFQVEVESHSNLLGFRCVAF